MLTNYLLHQIIMYIKQIIHNLDLHTAGFLKKYVRIIKITCNTVSDLPSIVSVQI